MSGELIARKYTVGYFVGSLSAESINRALAMALIRLAGCRLMLR
jgi:NAD(P)H-dependent FMN reductase